MTLTINCIMCGVELGKNEAALCFNCLAFIEWKYGSLEAYERVQRKALRAEVLEK